LPAFICFSVPFSVLEAISVLKLLHCASNSAFFIENILALDSEQGINFSGLSFIDFGMDGRMPALSLDIRL
jgi:hypothetical protein